MSFSASAQQSNDISCFGGDNGSITVATDGGQAPFMYSLDGTNFQASNSFDNLTAGEYTITISDNDGNITTSNAVVISEPNEISVSTSVDENTITINASGGTGVLEYSMDNSTFQSGNVFDNLPNGDYIFYVRDENDCVVSSMTATVLINDLVISASLTGELSCFNGNDASITVNVSGGTATFNYSINGGPTQTSNVFAGLDAGTYTITVGDANQFTASSNTITIENPSELILSLSTLGNELTANGSGGTSPYQYSLDGTNYQNENVFANLVNGAYTIYLRDDNDCVVTSMLNIDIEALSAAATITDEILCNGDATASFSISVSGGTSPYQYVLNNNFQDSNVFENLGAGSYR